MKTFIGLRCNKAYKKKNGCSQLYLLIGIDKEFDKLALDLDWLPHLLDETNNRLLPRTKPDKVCNDYNLIIRDSISRANNIFIEHRLSGRDITMEQFFNIYKDYERLKDFIVYMDAKIQERYKRKKISEGTKKSHVNCLLWLKEFKPKIAFKDLTKKLVESFEAWLQKQVGRRSTVELKKLDPNTIANIMKYFKAYITLAIKDEVPIENPFKKADVSTHQNRKLIDHLQPKEVAVLMNYYDKDDIPLGEKLTLCRFLIACMLSLRISDILKLDRERLNGHQLSRKLAFHPKKQQLTKSLKTVYVPIDDIAMRYLIDCVELQEQARSKSMTISEPYGRKVLKKIALKTGIKATGFHTGRHTFGTNYLRAGGKIYNLQHIMGHSKLDTTMIYVHIVEEDTEEEMLLLSNLYQKYRV